MKRIKKIKKEIDNFAKELLGKYSELDSVSIDACYGTDGYDNSLKVSAFELQEVEK